MDPSELLRIVDTIHRDKNIDKEIVFEGIEAALVSAAKKHYGEEEDIQIVRSTARTGRSPARTTASPWRRKRWPSGSAPRRPSR